MLYLRWVCDEAATPFVRYSSNQTLQQRLTLVQVVGEHISSTKQTWCVGSIPKQVCPVSNLRDVAMQAVYFRPKLSQSDVLIL